jgi:hypothetical protein
MWPLLEEVASRLIQIYAVARILNLTLFLPSPGQKVKRLSDKMLKSSPNTITLFFFQPAQPHNIL